MSTIRDVARLAGVSVSTVSLAFNSPSRVSASTARRIISAAESLGYTRADPIAQSLSSGRSRLIGMIVADISNAFFGRLLREVERHAHENGYLVLVSDTHAEPDREQSILQHMISMRVAGILLSPCGVNTHQTRHLSHLKTPCILFDQKPEAVSADFVGTDNALATSMLTEHLIQLGHQRIALVRGTDGLFTTEERTRGFVETMKASGLSVDSELVVDGRYTFEDSYAQTMRLLTRADRPSALIASSNVMSLGALQAIQDLGIHCPQDVSLAGIDDVPWMNMIRPRITRVIQPVEEMALASIKLLLERIEQQADKDAEPLPVENKVFAPILHTGESSGPVSSS